MQHTCTAQITNTINPGKCQEHVRHGNPHYCYYHDKMAQGLIRPIEGRVVFADGKTVTSPERHGRPGWYYRDDK